MAWKKYSSEEEKKEYGAQKDAERDKWSKEIDEGIKNVFNNSEDFKAYLDFCGKFHTYSYRNQMLIRLQNPNATFVASYSDWQKKFDRHVMKGEKGLKVLSPVTKEKEKIHPHPETLSEEEKKQKVIVGWTFRSTFDVSQTDGKPLPKLNYSLDGEYDEAKAKAIGDVLDRLTGFTHENVSREKMTELSSDRTSGLCVYKEKKLYILDSLSELEKVSVLVHESAHAVLHDPAEKDAETDRTARELQAESVAYMVCKQLGIDAGESSFTYLASWSYGKDVGELSKVLKNAVDCSNNFVKEIEKEFDARGLVTELSEEQETEKAVETTESDTESVKEETAEVVDKTAENANEQGAEQGASTPENDIRHYTDEGVMYFGSDMIEKEIPNNMRWKECSTSLDCDGGIYWVTQGSFSYEDLVKFQDCMKKYDIPKAFVTVRDLSTYDFETDKNNDVLIKVTKEEIDCDKFNKTCEKYGDEWAMVHPDSETVVVTSDKDVKNEPVRFYYIETNARNEVAVVDSYGKALILKDNMELNVDYSTLEKAKAEDYSSLYDCKTIEECLSELDYGTSDNVTTLNELLNLERSFEFPDGITLTPFVPNDLLSEEEKLKIRKEQLITDEILRGSGFANGKIRIDNYFNTQNPSTADFASFLKKEYGIGGHSGDGDVHYESHDSRGISIELKNGDVYTFTWTEVAKQTAQLIENDDYLTSNIAPVDPIRKPTDIDTAIAMWENGFTISRENGETMPKYDIDDIDSNDYSMFNGENSYYVDGNDYAKYDMFNTIADYVSSISDACEETAAERIAEAIEWDDYDEYLTVEDNVHNRLRVGDTETIEEFARKVNELAKYKVESLHDREDVMHNAKLLDGAIKDFNEKFEGKAQAKTKGRSR